VSQGRTPSEQLALLLRGEGATVWLPVSSPPEISMSALPPKADIRQRDCDVRFVPEADISRTGRGAFLYRTFCFHRQTEGSSCLAFAISALPLASLIFSFALPRLQRARALLGSNRIASLKSAMARSLSPLCA